MNNRELNDPKFKKLTDKCKKCQEAKAEGIMTLCDKHFSDIVKPIE